MQPILKKTTKEIVYEQLKGEILQGRISAEKIMTETSLAESLHISRTPVREAISELTNEGLLVHLPRKGFQVRKISGQELNQILYMRRAIEKRSIKKLIEHINDEEVNELENIVSEQSDALKKNNRIKYIELDQTFHRRLLKLSNQNILDKIFQDLYNMTLLIGHTAISNEGRMEEVIKEHSSIIKALRKTNEEEASFLMERHLIATGDSVKKKLKSNLKNS